MGLGVLIRLVCRDFGRDLIRDPFFHSFRIIKETGPLVVELFEYIGKRIQFHVGLSASSRSAQAESQRRHPEARSPLSPSFPRGSYPCRWIREFPLINLPQYDVNA